MEVNSDKHRLAFLATWYHEEATLIKRFTIFFFPMENAVEVIDQKKNKIFLRHTKMPELTENDFYIGSKIVIFGRVYNIVGYADEVTRRALSKNNKTFLLLQNSIISKLGEILCSLIDSKIIICNAAMVEFTPITVREFLGEERIRILKNELLAGPCIGLQIMAENIIDIMKRVVTKYEECKKDLSYPRALISLFDDRNMINGTYVAPDEQSAARDSKFFFSRKTGPMRTCLMENTTLAIIKPHVIKEGKLGKIIKDITSHGFLITGLRMQFLDRVNCEEFYEIYKGVIPEYIKWVAQLSSGISVALEIKCANDNKDSYGEFRKYCGPVDPEFGRMLRPKTLRALYGIDKTLNAIHCTDLPIDTEIELRYFFRKLN